MHIRLAPPLSISAVCLAAAACATAAPVVPAAPAAPAASAAPGGSAGAAPGVPTASAETYSLARTGSVRDFDFLAGAWTVTNRRLKARGAGSTEWDEFPAAICASIYLEGVANVDEIRFPTKGWAGVTLRTFNVERRQWSIYWVNSRTGVLYPPVVGGFDGDRGEFYGEDDDDGRPVKVRFRWTKRGADRASWEQAFSYDGARTWETNWTNELTRTAAAACAAAGAPRR